MTKASLKKKLHETIDQIDDQNVLKTIHSIAQAHLIESELTPEQIKELDETLADIESGKAELFTWDEVKSEILAKKRKSKRN